MMSSPKVLKIYLSIVVVIGAGLHVWIILMPHLDQKSPPLSRRLVMEFTTISMTNAKYLKVKKDEGNDSKSTSLRQLAPSSNRTKLLKTEPSKHAKSPWSEFPYPLDIDMEELVRKLKANLPVKHKPVFVYRYNFTNYRVDKCVEGSPFFIFLIKSAVNNAARRAAIRETWANTSLIEQYNSVRMFLVGASDEQAVRTAVEDENNLHKDLLIMSFRDNYYNNTLKTIGAIHWTVKHCNRSKFVVFVDDDMLVSTTRLVDFLKSDVTLPNFFGGYLSTHWPPRDNTSKWYVNKEDYPHDVYPPMPSAGFMIMTMNFVVDLHFASQYTKKFIYDDCYLGILAYKLHVKPVFIRSVYMGYVNVATHSHSFNSHMLAAHSYSPEAMKRSWSILQKNLTTSNRV